MNATRAASLAALLGGLVWVVAAAMDWGDDVNPIVYLVGLVWFVVALACTGYALVDHAPVWLRAVVSVATPALGYAVWVTVKDAFDRDYVAVLGAGLLLLVAGLVAMRRTPSGSVEAPVRGRRAAR